MMESEQKGYLELIIYSVLAGFVGVIVKLVQNLDVYSIVFFRASIATLFIFLIILFSKRIKGLSISSPFRTLLVGLFQGLSIFLFFYSILNTSVSNAVFLIYTAPIFSVILAKIMLKEKIEKSTLAGIAVTLVGILFILDPAYFSFKSEETLGNLMGLASGFFYSAMTLTAKPLMRKKSGYYAVFWQYLIISAMFVFFLKVDSIAVVLENWWKLLIIGVISTGIAFIFFYEGVKKVKGQKIFIVTALEPLTGTVLAMILLKEIPPLMTILGAVLIIYGVYGSTKRKIQSTPLKTT
jgi:drug/metabolite transporter, DME family